MAFTWESCGALEYLRADGIAARHAFSARAGGVSEGCFAALNLGFHRGDDPQRVLENYRILGAALGVAPEAMVRTHQTHTNLVCRVDEGQRGAGITAPQLPPCDALITDTPGLALVIATADCTPVLLYDPRTGAVGAAHAGWRGTAGDIVGRTVSQMAQSFGTRAGELHAAIGPCIGPCCFETDADVPDAMRAQLGSAAEAWIRQAGDKYYVNLKELNACLLRRAGVEQIEICPECTACSPERFWSHRRHGAARGTQGAVIVCAKDAK